MIRLFEGKEHAGLYRKYRPQTCPLVMSMILDYMKEGNLHPHNDTVVDVGCGSGQHTVAFAPHFRRVYGYDVSPAQINAARQEPEVPSNVTFHVGSAESLSELTSGSVDLVTCCQAVHWFDLPKFFAEVDRVLRPGGTVAFVGQLLREVVHPSKTDELNRILEDFIQDHLAPFYHEKLDYIFNSYRDLPAPYPDEVRYEGILDEMPRTVAYLIGYFSTWSCFQSQYKEKPEATLALLEKLQADFLKTMGMNTPPEGTPLMLQNRYFMVLCRKPMA